MIRYKYVRKLTSAICVSFFAKFATFFVSIASVQEGKGGGSFGGGRFEELSEFTVTELVRKKYAEC